jgi:hypothetical protein
VRVSRWSQKERSPIFEIKIVKMRPEPPIEGLLHRANLVLRMWQIIHEFLFFVLRLNVYKWQTKLRAKPWILRLTSVHLGFGPSFWEWSSSFLTESLLLAEFIIRGPSCCPQSLSGPFKIGTSWFLFRWLESNEYWSGDISVSYATFIVGNGIR